MEKSNLEVIAEFLEGNPSVAAFMNEEDFAIFYEYPQDVIKLYESTLEFMRTSFQVPEQILLEDCKVFITDACNQVNLNNKAT